MRLLNAVHLCCLAVLSPVSATASTSEWHDAEGGRIRLVTAGVPDARGALRGILEIDLEPGWKTYWRDPGDAGVPPQIDISRGKNIASAEFGFPAPERFNDGGVTWAGYKHSVALPVTFRLEKPDAPALIEADVFLGICETICIPVQGRLTVDPSSDPDNAADTEAVAAAFEGLPSPEQPDFGAAVVSTDDKNLLVRADVPGNPSDTEIFIAGEEGYMFGTPIRRKETGKVFFSVPILSRPSDKPAGEGLPYTLVTGGGAVEGTLPFP
jgi:DsbC/DsbD-like thiol-disulfide interchange protein